MYSTTRVAQLSGALLGAVYVLGALWGISCGLFSVGWDLLRLLTGRRACVRAPSTAQPQQHVAGACSGTAPTTPEPAPRGCAPAAITAKPPGTPTPAQKAPAPAVASPTPGTAKPTKAAEEPLAGPAATAAAAAAPPPPPAPAAVVPAAPAATAAERVQVEVLTEALLLAETEAKAAQAAEAGRAWLARHEQPQQQQQPQHQPQQSAAAPAPVPSAVLEALVGSLAEAGRDGPGAAAASEFKVEHSALGEQLGAAEQLALGLEQGAAAVVVVAQDGEQSERGDGSGRSGSGTSAASFFTATSADQLLRRSESPVTPSGAGSACGAGACAAGEDCEPGSSSSGTAAGDVERAALPLTSGRLAVAGVEEARGEGAEAGAARPAHKRSYHGHRRGGGAKGGGRS
ncbi:hypothetical protein HYH02_008664 [Chlamydomonas schloesseri]|uniref:Uncharacterized protein n=1 Tax=Chlamydomonas schloesseri TaxID=2026947 RepID=A0A835WD49_9CHLO|nr:hypothetical protein HYH02_008664 [Chlamydomonas schloesseri]|eukprot:KAG2445196.1 hypothetical protein HYH02_008664 [Chlamydomonas schloesseri]